MSSIISFPIELRPALPTIVGNVDYLQFRLRLEQIDQLLLSSGLEKQFIESALQAWLGRSRERPPTARQQQIFQERARRGLRCNILRTLLQEDFRGFTCQLAGNPLYQWFCSIAALDQVRVPSKSQLQRFTQLLDKSDEIRLLNNTLLQAAIKLPGSLELERPLDLDEYFLDTTCLKANIHFPVDWVLLRDATRTLMKAVKLIRAKGLKGRMEAPEEFMKRMNRLCIEMTHTRHKTDGKKKRKKVLRQMKKLVKVVAEHARRHRQKLDQQWDKTDWTRPQAEQVLARIDQVLELLPKAEKQAHERIIGERQVNNAEKVLSLYEKDVHVLVRGKAGADVEFGNKVLLGENAQGIILDYQVWKEQGQADMHLLVDSLDRLLDGLDRKVAGVAADRGFASKKNSEGLQDAGIFNAVCPKKPQDLKERMKDKQFVRMQKRRSQTEARISIMQRGFFGRPMRAKGYANRELTVGWGVLTHNLWKLACLKRKPEKLAKAA